MRIIAYKKIEEFVEKDYEAIMARIDELVEIVEEDTPKTAKEYVELDFLANLIVAYEKAHYKINV